MDIAALATRERADLLDLLRTLSPRQWDEPSLLPGWSVKDIAAHVIGYEELSLPVAATRILRDRLAGREPNDVAVERLRALTTAELLARYERHRIPHGLTAAFGGRIALTDALIHHQDIRRTLGLPRTVPSERLLPALIFALRAPTIPARRNATGLRVVATDSTWTHGRGPEVTGPGESLLMALAGRGEALVELSGAGLPTLRSRVTG